MNYTCIAFITIDSVAKMDKKYFLKVYLGECKHKIKKTQMLRFINAELKSDVDGDDSDDDSDSHSDSDSDDDSDDDLDNDFDDDSDDSDDSDSDSDK